MKKWLLTLTVLGLITAPAWACGLCPMGAPPFPPMAAGGSRIAQLLLALAAGYGVLALAARQSRKLALTGTLIGWFIVVVSVAGLVCTAGRALCMRCHERAAAACPFSAGDAGVAPMDEPTPEDAPPAAPEKAEKKAEKKK